jgi:hypothetical protein
MVALRSEISERRVKTTLPREYREEESSPGFLTTFLGVFSLGLGLAEMLAPAQVGARTGVPYRGLIRAYGAREFAAGVGILTSKKPASWLWARVAGDVLDLTTLAGSFELVGESGRRRALEAAAAVAGVTVLDVIAALANSHCSRE